MAELCEHNAKVAAGLGRHNIAMLWQFVSVIYSSMPKQNPDPFRSQTVTQNLLNTRMILAATNANDSTEDKAQNVHELSADETMANDFAAPKPGDFHKTLTVQPNGNNSATSDALNNIVYGDVELTVDNMDCIKSLRNGFLYIGPHDLTKNLSWPSDTMMNHDMQQNSRSHNLSRERHEASPVRRLTICSISLNHFIRVFFLNKIWPFSNRIAVQVCWKS